MREDCSYRKHFGILAKIFVPYRIRGLYYQMVTKQTFDPFFTQLECPTSVFDPNLHELSEVDLLTKIFRNIIIDWCPRQTYVAKFLAGKLDERFEFFKLGILDNELKGFNTQNWPDRYMNQMTF